MSDAPFDVLMKTAHRALQEIDRLQAENKQLRADVERLRQALRVLPFKEGFKD